MTVPASTPPRPSVPPRPKSVTLFCGSSAGDDPRRVWLAQSFGRLAAQGGWRLVYGAASIGLMGAAAKAALAEGGAVLGVIPEFLMKREVVLGGIRLRPTKDLHDRKRILANEGDGFVVLPGGVGTLEEVAEVLSWARLDLHVKPIVFLDPEGFWSPLLTQLEAMAASGFLPKLASALYTRVETPEAALELIGAARDRGLGDGAVAA